MTLINNEIKNCLVKKERKKDPFIRIDRRITDDKSISWKAKGLLQHLLAQSEDWMFYESEIVKHSKDGLKSTRAGLEELENAGYLIRIRRRSLGKFVSRDWYIYEVPIRREEIEKEKTRLENLSRQIDQENDEAIRAANRARNIGIDTRMPKRHSGKISEEETRMPKTDIGFSDIRFSNIGKGYANKNNSNNNNNNKNNNNNNDVELMSILNDLLITAELPPIIPSSKSIEIIPYIKKIPHDQMGGFVEQLRLLMMANFVYDTTLENPVAYIIQNPEQIETIAAGKFPRKKKKTKTQKLKTDEYTFYVSAEEKERLLKAKGQ